MKTNNNIVTPVKVTDSATAEVSLSNANETTTMNPTQNYVLGDSEYLSDYTDQLECQLRERSVMLISPPGTGKTEMMKKLFRTLDKVIIVFHQTNILESKLDDELRDYEVTLEMALNPAFVPRDKMIMRWEIFNKIMPRLWVNDYYYLCDESHNFITQFNFRRVIIPIVKFLNSKKHVLFLTGTPMGEDCILQNPITMRFKKNNSTIYKIVPFIGQYSEKPIIKFKQDVLRVFKDSLKDFDCVVLYDNMRHNEWNNLANMQDIDTYRYSSTYRKSRNVQSINYKLINKKIRIIATCYFGEGIDMIGFEKALIIFPIDYSYCKNIDAATKVLNVIQASKRFRDARYVKILLFERANGTYHSVMSERLKMNHYINEIERGGMRSDTYDKLYKLEDLTSDDIQDIFNKRNEMLHSLYWKNFFYISDGIVISESVLNELQTIDGDIEVLPVNRAPMDVEIKNTKTYYRTSEEEDTIMYINTHIESILNHIRTDNNQYEDTIKSIELGMRGVSYESPYRSEIRAILQLIRTVDDWGCLSDVLEEFGNAKSRWKKIARFVDAIKLQIKIVNHQAILYNAKKSDKILYSESDAKRQKEIAVYVDMLNLEIEPDKTMVEMIAQYKQKNNGKSIFRKHDARRPKHVKKKYRLIHTDGTETTEMTYLEAVDFLSVTPKTFYKHLNKQTQYNGWRIQQCSC